MSLKNTVPIESQNEISGYYLGCSGSFTSGAWWYTVDNYGPTLEHLITVLKNIPETESNHWGHKGFFVNRWVHHQVKLQCHQFESLNSFLEFLTLNKISSEFS